MRLRSLRLIMRRSRTELEPFEDKCTYVGTPMDDVSRRVEARQLIERDSLTQLTHVLTRSR